METGLRPANRRSAVRSHALDPDHAEAISPGRQRLEKDQSNVRESGVQYLHKRTPTFRRGHPAAKPRATIFNPLPSKVSMTNNPIVISEFSSTAGFFLMIRRPQRSSL